MIQTEDMKLLTQEQRTFHSWHRRQHDILVSIDSSHLPSPGEVIQKGVVEYCAYCAASQLRNTDFWKCALLKQAWPLLWKKHWFNIQGFLLWIPFWETAQIKTGHDLAFLTYPRRHVGSWEIHGRLYIWVAGCPVQHVIHHSYASGSLLAYTNGHIR